MHTSIAARCALLLLLALPGLGAAQDFDCASVDAPPIASMPHRDRLNALEQNGCLGGGNDTDPFTREIMGALPGGGTPHSPGVSDEERRAATLDALARVNDIITAQIATPPASATPGAGERLLALQNALFAARNHVAEARENEGLQRPGYWKYNPNTGGFNPSANASLRIDVQLFQGFLDEACRERDSAQCAGSYAVSKQILRDARLVERSLSYYASPIIDMNYRAALKRDRQWTAYFDEALFQYPWELFINGLWMDKHDERPRDAAGNRLGFRAPPRSQWIIFHPNVGLEYLGGAADGNQFEPTVFVELIGYNRWRWNAAGELKNALGLSLITSYSDRAGADDMAYGLMLHYRNKWSLAVTRHDEETGVLLSTDLAQYLSSTSEKARKVLRFAQ